MNAFFECKAQNSLGIESLKIEICQKIKKHMKKTGLNDQQVPYFSSSSIFLNNRTAPFNDTYAMLKDAKQSIYSNSVNQNKQINGYYFLCYFFIILISIFNNNFQIQFVNI